MKRTALVALTLMAWLMLAASSGISASAAPEVYVVASDLNGISNFMAGNEDGTFSSQQEMTGTGASGGKSYGSGIGDFDNDGDFDYIIGYGKNSGSVYLFEKVGPGNQFASPVAVASWNQGTYPAGMAIADFNEDGNLDFVLTFNDSTDSVLYVGDGNFGFTPYLLEATAPSLSFSADSADVNNDGHADFIVAPYSGVSQFYVNLGNGEGAFETITVDTYGHRTYWGLAAADFDGDGMVDLAATYIGLLDIYTGNGKGSFVWSYRVQDTAIWFSPLDNYDFDNDGNQDLVIGRYGLSSLNNRQNVAVFWGDGNGSFTYSDVYGGGSDSDRFVIAAPSYENNNEEPFALVDPAYQEITVGEAVYFDGSESYDEDGEIVSYVWDFGDGSPAEDTFSMMSSFKETSSGLHVFSDIGLYTVTLTVTDDKGAISSALAQVNVTAVPAKITFSPKVFNLGSKGKWVTAKIELPSGYDASRIDLSSLCIAEGDSRVFYALSDPKYGFTARVVKIGRKRHAKSALMVKFDRQAIADAATHAMTTQLRKFHFFTIDHLRLEMMGKVLHNNAPVDFSGSDRVYAIAMHGRDKKAKTTRRCK
jgi:hypothetical protein